MGFRSTFTTSDIGTLWPVWFREKYVNIIIFPEYNGALHPHKEAKTYGSLESLAEDIQLAIDWWRPDLMFIVMYLHECGGVTRCQIQKDSIKYSEPEAWRVTDGVEHWYCYGCSDV